MELEESTMKKTAMFLAIACTGAAIVSGYLWWRGIQLSELGQWATHAGVWSL